MNLWWSFFQTKVFTPYKVSPQESRILLEKFPNPDVIRTNKEVADQASEENQLPIDPETVGKQARNAYQRFALEIPDLKRLRGANREKAFQAWLKPKFEEYQQHIQNQFGSNRGSPECDWQQVCHQMMWSKQKENQRIRQKANVYVGLGWVQREYQQRRRGNEHERSQIYGLAEEVIIERYPHNEFLTKVIDVDSNKHVAIIGEPGAGKTTLLTAIADHLLKSNSTKVPIFLSLARLQQRTIQWYLIDVWLPEAFRLSMGSEIEASDRESFRGWLAQGEAWLLLDGVDEMGETHPVSALHQIRTQLTDWLGQVRVGVTCRLNVWDAQLNNPLEGIFDVFKTQDFEPEQVSDFIQQWFSQSRKPDRGEILQAKLAESQRERIRELVRNPLRLSLLCDVFYTNPDAELPSTKAGLYEQFVRYFYEWKSEQHSTTEPQRERLNAALGKLAIAGLDDKAGLHRFRLPEKAARQVMGNDEFELVEKLGWLNIVDQDLDSAQSVYAFFHPTFQEYFAALAIDDWHFFLNHIPHNPHIGKYKIFNPLWKEVILLWLGRQDIGKALKDELILTLKDFSDSCGGHYWLQSFSLAAEGLSEFKSEHTTQIVMKLVHWACHTDIDFLYVWVLAQKTIRLTDKEAVLQELFRLINKTEYTDVKAYAIELLEELDVRKTEFYRILSLDPELISLCEERHFFKIKYRGFSDTLVKHREEEARQLFFERKLSSLGLRDVIQNSELDANYKILSLINKIHINKTNKKSDLVIVFDFLFSKLIDSINLSTLSKVVSTLKNLLNLDHLSGNYNALLWSCAQNMSYPEFYEAWHSPLANGSEFDAVGDEGL